MKLRYIADFDIHCQQLLIVWLQQNKYLECISSAGVGWFFFRCR